MLIKLRIYTDPYRIIAFCIMVCLAMPIAKAELGDELFKLTASDAAANDSFGYSTSLAGDIILVGAPTNASAGAMAGSAYLYSATTGLESYKLTAADAGAGDRFGHSVSVSGSRAIVSAVRDDDLGTDAGAVYVFDADNGEQLRKLTASDGEEYDYFGQSVALSEGKALIGAFRDSDGGALSGSAYLFDVETGEELFKFTASDASAGDQFGYSVALSGNYAVIGAYRNSSVGSLAGSVYVFDATTGEQLHQLNADDASPEDLFGSSVAISGTTALIGAPYFDAETSEGPIDRSGAAYLFDVITGQQLRQLTPEEPSPGGWFGNRVSLSGNTAAVSRSATFVFDAMTGALLFEQVGRSNVTIDGDRILATGPDPDGGTGVTAVYVLSAEREILPVFGDFDLDGDVDGRDFLAWQRDPSIGDLSDWQANYGFIPPTDVLTAVPEPATLGLAVLLILFAGCHRRNPLA